MLGRQGIKAQLVLKNFVLEPSKLLLIPTLQQ